MLVQDAERLSALLDECRAVLQRSGEGILLADAGWVDAQLAWLVDLAAYRRDELRRSTR